MKLYKDSSLKEEIGDLDLGIVEAGSKKEYTFYVYNELKANLIEIEFAVNHKEIKILKAPENLESLKSDKLIIEWSPSVTLKEGLKTQLLISTKELWK